MSAYRDLHIFELLKEVDCVDRKTLEINEEIQHKGCPFCDIDDGEIVEDYQTDHALFYKFKKCNQCLLIYPYPRPNKKWLEDFHTCDRISRESELRFKHIDELPQRRPMVEKIARFIWHAVINRYEYDEFIKYTKKGYRVLAVGAGHGLASQKLREKGCIVETVEPNPYRAQYLRNKGFKVYESLFDDVNLERGTYDVVIFSQVLMHLFSLKSTMAQVKKALRPGGLIISSQMNYNSIIQKTLRSPYPGQRLTAHSIVSWFTEESIRKILEQSGFRIKCVMYRPTGLLSYLFVDGYPGGLLARSILKIMDKAIAAILVNTRTSDYFSVVAELR